MGTKTFSLQGHRLLAAFLSVCMLTLFLLPPAQAAAAGTGTYQVSHSLGVNLRASASTSSRILLAIPKGVKLSVTEIKSGWGKTSYRNKSGWVSLEFCQKVGQAQSSSQSSSSGTGNYQVSHSLGVNLRASASTSSKILLAIPKGVTLSVTEVKNGWGKTSYRNKSGWVSLEFCKKIGQAQSSSSSSSNGSSTSSATSSGYNPSAALSFAKKHATTDKSWLCAEYVSRSLQAGGLNISTAKGVRTLYDALAKTKGVTKNTLKVEKNGSVLLKNNQGKIANGDVVTMYCAKCVNYDGKPYIHAVMISDASDKTAVRVYAHNNAKNNERYYAFNNCYVHGSGSHVTAYAFHFS